jgi:predicted phosphodiesterase
VYASPEPFEIDAGRVLVISDLHMPYHSPRAIEAALKYADEYRPHEILINGDLLDMYQMSRFDKDPTLPGIAHECQCGHEFFDHLRARFPRATLRYKLGNHDARFTTYLFQSAPLLAAIPGMKEGWEAPCGIHKNKVTVIDDKRPVMVGRLPIFHGHELGSSNFNPVNPARGAYLKTKHTIMVAHSHQTSGHSDPNLFHEETYCWSIGCLCGLSPRYATVNRWNHGFATVTVAKDGDFNVNNLRIANDGSVRTS